MDYKNFDVAKLDRDQLVELIKYHNRRYWERHDPEISDSRYDALVEALRRIEPGNVLLEQLGMGGPINPFRSMNSLDKVYSLGKLLEWGRKFARNNNEMLLVQPKYDGISAWFDGSVLRTRGKGTEEIDVSGKLPLIELEAPGYTGVADRPVRGEILIRNDVFPKFTAIRKLGGGSFKNQRNTAASLIGLLDEAAFRVLLYQKAHNGLRLTLVDYDLVSIQVPLDQLEFRWNELLAELGKLPYPQDGVVVKFADAEFRASLGSTAHHPRGEIAYKFSNDRRESRLLGVEWSFGKDSLTPVALLEPVDISGITIRRATLHNAQNIIDMGIMIGDRVEVERAGDVIPYIANSSPGIERRPALIEQCPSCGAKLVRRGPELACPNPECFETTLQRLLAALRSLGIERLGEPTLRGLMTRCGVRHLADLFKLTAADIRKLDNFGEKSTENLLNDIRKARVTNDYQLLAALNIPHVGVNMAKQLLTGRTLAELRKMDKAELAAIAGIGPERAAALAVEFGRADSVLDELLAAVTPVHADAEAELPTICFTGKMPEKRSFYEKLAVAGGYRPVGSVGRELTLLVATDLSASGGKLADARKFGIKVISTAEFLELIGESGGVNATELEPDDLFTLADRNHSLEKSDDTNQDKIESGDLFPDL